MPGKPLLLVCEPLWERFGVDSPQLGGHKAEWLFGICVLASCKGTAVLQPGMALVCVCSESWGQCLLTSLDLALPLNSCVFNPRSMKIRWLEQDQWWWCVLMAEAPGGELGEPP